MNIYLDNKFLNMKEIIDTPFPFIFVVGARGIGKTYGSLLEMIEKKEKFILLRTSDVECQLCTTEESNPFKSINRDYHTNIHIKKINKFMYGIYKDEEQEYRGLVMALTTFYKARGMDFSDVKYILYDEFIAQTEQKKINGIGEALMQAYETISRNRELLGEKPLKCICLANALNINNEVLIQFGIVSILSKMKKQGIDYKEDQERGILVICPKFSPISVMKANTVLYKVNKRFNEMALDNQFREYYDKNVISRNMRNFKLIVGYDRMFFYKDLSTGDTYVSSYKMSGFKVDHYSNTDFERKKFTQQYYFYVTRYYNDRIKFESPELELEFINLYNLK